MTIANPLYDVVFKYLMEDDRCGCCCSVMAACDNDIGVIFAITFVNN